MPGQRMDNETMIQWSSSHQRASAVGPRRKVKKFTQTKWAKEWKRDQSILLDITTAIFLVSLLTVLLSICSWLSLLFCLGSCLPFARHIVCPLLVILFAILLVFLFPILLGLMPIPLPLRFLFCSPFVLQLCLASLSSLCSPFHSFFAVTITIQLVLLLVIFANYFLIFFFFACYFTFFLLGFSLVICSCWCEWCLPC